MTEQSDAQLILESVRMLAAAFPRAAWRTKSDAVYTMALCDAGLAPDIVAAAVRKVILEHTELPSIAALIGVCRAVRADEAARAWRCPACGSGAIVVAREEPVWCGSCDWTAT
jgi:ribosomal protein S27AE